MQLNVRNKSAAGECYSRTEVCLEGCALLIDEQNSTSLIHSVFSSILSWDRALYHFLNCLVDVNNYSLETAFAIISDLISLTYERATTFAFDLER